MEKTADFADRLAASMRQAGLNGQSMGDMLGVTRQYVALLLTRQRAPNRTLELLFCRVERELRSQSPTRASPDGT